MTVTTSIVITEPMAGEQIKELLDACSEAMRAPRLAHKWTQVPSTLRTGNDEYTSERHPARPAHIRVIHRPGGPVIPGDAAPPLPDATFVEVRISIGRANAVDLHAALLAHIGRWLDLHHYPWQWYHPDHGWNSGVESVANLGDTAAIWQLEN